MLHRTSLDFTVERDVQGLPILSGQSDLDLDDDAGPDHINQRMFLDDIHAQLFPYGGETKDQTEVLIVEGGGDAAAEHVEALLSYGSADYGRHRPSEAFCEWAQNLVSTLLTSGSAKQELAPIVACEGEIERIVGYALLPLRGLLLSEPGGGCWQILPKRSLLHVDDGWRRAVPSGRRFIRLPASRTVSARLPWKLRSLRDTVAALGFLRSGPPMRFVTPLPPESKQRGVPFDFSNFRRTEATALASIAADSGWSGRSDFDRRASEFYIVHRYLRFERALVHLRSLAVDTLNGVLRRIGPVIGMECQVRIQGLPTSDDVQTAFDDLKAGRISATELIKRFSS
jgi:hypothetical protein